MLNGIGGMKHLKDISKITRAEKMWEESWRHVKTDVMAMSETLTEQANIVENKFKDRIGKLEIRIKDLEENINKHKNRYL